MELIVYVDESGLNEEPVYVFEVCERCGKLTETCMGSNIHLCEDCYLDMQAEAHIYRLLLPN